MPEPIFPDMLESAGAPITLAFAPEGKAYFSERISGNLWEMDHGALRLVKNFPIVPYTGHHETGLLGIALDPDFSQNGYIYCYYTQGTGEKDLCNRVVRIKKDGTSEEILLDGIPAGSMHNGGILAFASDKTLYIGTGVKNEEMQKSQDLDYLGGKILRINRDGSIPTDNPFPGSPVYSFGHRNIFGLAFHPRTGKLYISDVGPEKNDEINIIEKGGNYGWPMVTGKANNPNWVDPIVTYTPTITPTQCVFVGEDFYFGSFNEGSVHRLTLGGEKMDQVAKDEIVYRGRPFGVVGVFFGSDEKFYVTTPNKIIRFEPEVN
ncbi:hypothetical protein EPO05_04155 [Patescibacteria group bacterium]|nr:MAG: hypothetical protein EPO05_04155 [Patescibacteria group bacterium]